MGLNPALLPTLRYSIQYRSCRREWPGLEKKGRVERIAPLWASFSDTEFHGVGTNRCFNPKLSLVSVGFGTTRFLIETGP
jgi:hypothetical protein